jgi:hypothetical protein
MRLEGAINKECPGLGWASGQEGKPEIGQASGTFPEASGPERGRRWDLASQGGRGNGWKPPRHTKPNSAQLSPNWKDCISPGLHSGAVQVRFKSRVGVL